MSILWLRSPSRRLMMKTFASIGLIGLAVFGSPVSVFAAGSGANLQVCRVDGLREINRDGDQVALAVGTTSWNAGTVPLDWKPAPDARHPFIAQALYRFSNGRLEQIGIAGVKHGFYVAAAPGCGGQQCQGPSGQVLHPNCSDTYGVSNNSNQNRMGPRYEVNPWTGTWDPSTAHTTVSHTHSPLDHLLRVRNADLRNSVGSDVRFYIEAYYVHYQNADPNTAVAWQRVEAIDQGGVEWSFNHVQGLGSSGPGFVLRSAWPGAHVSELAQTLPVDRGVSADGRALVAARVSSTPDGKWRYEYALLNVDMDRQIGSFAISVPTSAQVSDVFFSAPIQPNETRNSPGGASTDDSPWASQRSGELLTWRTGKNPLRWGVMYNFGFTSDRAPVDGGVAVGLFKSGTPASVQGQTKVPSRLEATAVVPRTPSTPFVSKREMMAAGPSIALSASGPFPLAVPQAPQPLANLSINDHGDECVAAIGPIPPFSCLDGAIIPITVDGRELNAGEYTAGMACDRPVQLGLGDDGQCVPFARLGALPGVNAAGAADADVKWTFICRRYKLRSNPIYPKFEDVAIIGHRASTGATCFFQTLSGSLGLPDGIDATRVPPPAERQAQTPPGKIPAKDFWLSPSITSSIGCYQCHDSDPWIHTPYVDQVKGRPGDPSKPVVPDAARASDPMRYKFVGSQHFSNWPSPQHFEPLNNECVSCHRIGVERRSLSFIDYSIGLMTTHVTPSFIGYPASHWMPPSSEIGPMPLAQWNATFQASADQIRSCKLNPAQPACRKRLTNPP